MTDTQKKRERGEAYTGHGYGTLRKHLFADFGSVWVGAGEEKHPEAQVSYLTRLIRARHGSPPTVADNIRTRPGVSGRRVWKSARIYEGAANRATPCH